MPIDLLTLYKNHIWSPCTSLEEQLQLEPLLVNNALGSYIHLMDGKKVIDAISSWWCKSLGHNHPKLKKALRKQIEKFEHVILANTCNDVIAELSHNLGTLLPDLTKVFYAGDGSSAVEIAMKMSLHSRLLSNEPQKTQFIALTHSYHGETVGALSVSDLGQYRIPYEKMLFKTHFLSGIPYVSGKEDEGWNNSLDAWQKAEQFLNSLSKTATALILEPIVQGAGGMKIYSQDFLARLALWAKAHNIHLIADEIMTGLHRTGPMFACEHAKIIPDFICLSKGLTSGWLAFSAVIIKQSIYQLFYDNKESRNPFLHSHTFSGNALAASIALETIKIMRQEKMEKKVILLEDALHSNMLEVAEKTGKFTNIRCMGGIVAADLFNQEPKLAHNIKREAIKLGALLRPIGNSIYWLPPLNTKNETIIELKEITIKAIKNACQKFRSSNAKTI